MKELCRPSDKYMKYRRKLSLLTQGTKALKAFYSDLKDLYKLCEMEEEQWCEEHGGCHECKNMDYQCNMTTLIYNGFSDQALRDEYDKLGRKDRTVENMVSMAVSRELSKENAMAYANTNNTAIHTVKSFNKKPNITSSKKLKMNAVNVVGSMILETAQPKIKHALYAKNQGTLQSAAVIKIGDNPITSHLVLQEQINFNPTIQTKDEASCQSPYGEWPRWLWRRCTLGCGKNSIGPINYTDSADLVDNPNYKQTTSPTTDSPTTREQTQEIHGIEERCKEQAYTMVNMMKMEGKKIF